MHYIFIYLYLHFCAVHALMCINVFGRVNEYVHGLCRCCNATLLHTCTYMYLAFMRCVQVFVYARLFAYTYVCLYIHMFVYNEWICISLFFLLAVNFRKCNYLLHY